MAALVYLHCRFGYLCENNALGTVHLTNHIVFRGFRGTRVPTGTSTTVSWTWCTPRESDCFFSGHTRPAMEDPPARAGQALQELPSWGATTVS
jgi:hypothetical protein